MKQCKTYLNQTLIFCLIVLILPSGGKGQSTQLADIPFALNGNSVSDPFTGGTLTPQYNEIDLNLDGVLDLVIYDRRGFVLTTYIYDMSTGKYNYQPEYREIFPELRNILFVRDYNLDGVPDLYTGDLFSNSNYLSVYKGSIVDNQYQWEVVQHSVEIFPNIYYEENGLFKEVYSSFVDKSEIADIDGDGDMDILTFEDGGANVYLYQNMTIEEGRDYDDHYYRLTDECFGKFIESGTSSSIFLSDSPEDCYETQLTDNQVEFRHAGSTITAFDEDGDGDMELLIGDLLSNSLVRLFNDGTPESAWMSKVDETFPSYDVPVEMPVWLAAFVIDADHNGTQDLLVSPNALSNAENINNAWLYLNSGTEGFDLTLSQDDFLKEETLDFGSYSSPKFADVNADGLIDIVCGTRGAYNNNMSDDARLLYFQNVGSTESPSYRLQDDDFGNLNQFSNSSVEYHPGFGDLDSDGDIDLLVGQNRGYIFYLENTAGEGNPMVFNNAIGEYLDIKPSNAGVKPAIYDVDKDGLSDIIIGERNPNTNITNGRIGSLNYYHNIGSIGSPFFDRESLAGQNTPTMGFVNGMTPGESSASSAPVFYDTDEGTLLFIGTRSGKIQVYGGDLSNPHMAYDTITLNLGNIYEGKNSSLDVADIDSDGFLELVLSNERGGIAIYNTTVVASTGEILSNIDPIPDQSELKIFPNPAQSHINLLGDELIVSVALYCQLGKLLSTTQVNANQVKIEIPVAYNGLIYARVKLETGVTITKRILVTD